MDVPRRADRPGDEANGRGAALHAAPAVGLYYTLQPLPPTTAATTSEASVT